MYYSRLRASVAANWRALVIATCSAAIVVAALLYWPSPTPSANKSTGGPTVGFALVNRPAPAFSLPQLEGKGTVALSALHGRPVVINFWSSTCAVCKQETPAIAQVARTLGDRVSFLGIDSFDSRGPALAFINSNHVPYEVAYDPQGSAADRYGVPALPETFFLSRSGKQILGINLGALTPDNLMAILGKLYGVTR
ncbi:MAG: TlpA family protein disulfide reductase [Streptosporangiaceae bacterium]